jgi:hypothetical protein
MNTKKTTSAFIKLWSSPSLTISIIALVISASSVYFQFFHERHSILYTTLTPEIDNKRNLIVIPLLLKNTGNQTEVILNSELQLEVKKIDRNFFKRISPGNNKDYFIILSPNEFKTIYLVGNFRNYMFGTFEFEVGDTTSYIYSPITVFDNLLLKVNISYLTTHGEVANEEREISKIFFDKSEKISRIDCNPTELKKLNLNYYKSKIVRYSIVPDASIFDSTNSNLIDSVSIRRYMEKLQLFNDKKDE